MKRRIDPCRSCELEPWAARRGCGMKYGAPQRAGWCLDRGERESREVPLADPPVDHAPDPNGLDALCPPKGTRLGRDSEQCANHPADGDAEQATMFSQVSVVAKQWPNEMSFSGERSESAATTG